MLDHTDPTVLKLLQDLDRYVYGEHHVPPDRLLRMLVVGPVDEEEKKTLALILQGAESGKYIYPLIRAGAVPSASLVRIARSLHTHGYLDRSPYAGVTPKKLIGELEDVHTALVHEGKGLPDPGPTRRRGAGPSLGPRTPAERKALSRRRRAAAGHKSRTFTLSPSAVAALARLKSGAAADATLDDIVSAALEEAAGRAGHTQADDRKPNGL
jgi:hypothetical protein